jgi:hypothetical protein
MHPRSDCPSPRPSPPPPRFQNPLQPSLSHTPEHDDFRDNEAEGEGSELEIDELSDDEDNRRAHAFLRTPLSQDLVPGIQSTFSTVPQLSPFASQDQINFTVSNIRSSCTAHQTANG